MAHKDTQSCNQRALNHRNSSRNRHNSNWIDEKQVYGSHHTSAFSNFVPPVGKSLSSLQTRSFCSGHYESNTIFLYTPCVCAAVLNGNHANNNLYSQSSSSWTSGNVAFSDPTRTMSLTNRSNLLQLTALTSSEKFFSYDEELRPVNKMHSNFQHNQNMVDLSDQNDNCTDDSVHQNDIQMDRIPERSTITSGKNYQWLLNAFNGRNSIINLAHQRATLNKTNSSNISQRIKRADHLFSSKNGGPLNQHISRKYHTTCNSQFFPASLQLSANKNVSSLPQSFPEAIDSKDIPNFGVQDSCVSSDFKEKENISIDQFDDPLHHLEEPKRDVQVTVVSGMSRLLRTKVIDNILENLPEDARVVVLVPDMSRKRKYNSDQAPASSSKDMTYHQTLFDELEDKNIQEIWERSLRKRQAEAERLANIFQQEGEIKKDYTKPQTNVKGKQDYFYFSGNYTDLTTIIQSFVTSNLYDYILYDDDIESFIHDPTHAPAKELPMIEHPEVQKPKKTPWNLEVGHVLGVIDSIEGAKIDAWVAVTDATHVLKQLNQDSNGPVKGDEEDKCNGIGNQSSATVEDKGIQALRFLSLLEHANVVVLARDADTSNEEAFLAENILSYLNVSATILSAVDAKAPLKYVHDTKLFDRNALESAATWKRLINDSDVPEDVRKSTYVYRASRPFHPTRLYEAITDVKFCKGVVRSHGTLWLATRMNCPLKWNQVGRTGMIKAGSPFYAALSEQDRPADLDTSKWDPRFGDRETKLVFVGHQLDKKQLESLLDSCLLLDDEMVFSIEAWAKVRDPFADIVPLNTCSCVIPVEPKNARIEERNQKELKVQADRDKKSVKTSESKPEVPETTCDQGNKQETIQRS